MKLYKCTIHLDIEASSKKEAIKKFWDWVDDKDYPIQPTVEELEDY